MDLRINSSTRYLLFVFLISFILPASAETLYVIDSLNIGLHQERSVDSPITKLVPSGTELTVIERADDLILVKEPEGIQGWINVKYVVAQKPGRARLAVLENENNKLLKEIEILKTKSQTAINTGSTAATGSQKQLEQQLNSERLKAGELQAELTDLKARIADLDDSDKFLSKIEKLKQENKQLIAQMQSSGIDVKDTDLSVNNGTFGFANRKQLITTCIIVLIIGVAAGAYLLDFLNRRRHGGFRV